MLLSDQIDDIPPHRESDTLPDSGVSLGLPEQRTREWKTSHFLYFTRISMGAPRKNAPKDTAKTIEDLAAQGHSIIGIAKRLGVSRETFMLRIEPRSSDDLPCMVLCIEAMDE